MRIEDVIGHRITVARAATGMKQEQIGEKLGAHLGKAWPRQAVSAAEKGRRAFTAAELVAFAMVLGCTIESLLEPPADVQQIELGGDPPLDSRHLRSATASNDDLKDLIAAMSELRRAVPEIRLAVNDVEGHAKTVERLMNVAVRELWTTARGRGIDADQEELDARNADQRRREQLQAALRPAAEQ